MRRGFAIYLIATFVSIAFVAYSQEVTRPLLPIDDNGSRIRRF